MENKANDSLTDEKLSQSDTLSHKRNREETPMPDNLSNKKQKVIEEGVPIKNSKFIRGDEIKLNTNDNQMLNNTSIYKNAPNLNNISNSQIGIGLNNQINPINTVDPSYSMSSYFNFLDMNVGMATNLINIRPSTGNSTYNIYQNLAQYSKVGNIPNQGFKYSGNPYLQSKLNKLTLGTYGYGPKYFTGQQGYASGMYNYNPMMTSNQLQPQQNYTGISGIYHPNLPQKQKYEIKDIPELTVGSYLQSKNVQNLYLNSVKRKEGEETTNSTTVNTIELKNEQTGIINKFLLEDTVSNNNLSIPQSSQITNVTNYNIHNYNYNFNTINPTDNIPQTNSLDNSVILQTKSVAPQLNIGPNNQNKTVTSNKGNVINLNNNLNTININSKNSSILGQPQVSSNSGNTNITKNQATKSGEFSEPLQKYIHRSYEKCKSENDRQKCQKALLKIINAALKKGDLNTRDWNKFPLPVLPNETNEDVGLKTEKIVLTEQELKNREKRKGRFEEKLQPNHGENLEIWNSNQYPSPWETKSQVSTIVKPQQKFVGTCTNLEKPYLRLTTVPDPSQIRPESILNKSLQMLKMKWKNKQADYNFISEQFRSIRQDMTIQHIENEFTIKVYETHARIALESLDLDQFNQCQTALISLYKQNIKGSEIEFLAYRIIYSALQGIRYELEILIKEIYKTRKEIKEKHFEIGHAWKVMKAINSNNYFEFFKLYKIAPNMGSYLMDPFLPRLRIKALQQVALGYYTEVNLSFLSSKLAYEVEDLFIKFLEENEIKLNNDKTKILCKDSLSAINNSKLLTSVLVKVNTIY